MEQGLQGMNSQNKLAKWAEQITECRSSGQTVKAWCKEQGICEQTYYRWQRKLVELTQEGERFAEITPETVRAGVAVTVRMGGISAEIRNGADRAIVETVLLALRTC